MNDFPTNDSPPQLPDAMAAMPAVSPPEQTASASAAADPDPATDADESNEVERPAREPSILIAAAEGHVVGRRDLYSFPLAHSDCAAPFAADAVECKDSHSFEIDSRVASEGHAVKCKELQPFEVDDEDESDWPQGDRCHVWDAVDDDPELRKLSDRQRTAIELLVLGGRDVNVADQIGVHPVTLWRWKQQPALNAGNPCVWRRWGISEKIAAWPTLGLDKSAAIGPSSLRPG